LVKNVLEYNIEILKKYVKRLRRSRLPSMANGKEKLLHITGLFTLRRQ
jgi:hypothetical protein